MAKQIHVTIVEDEQVHFEALKKFLDRYGKEKGVDFLITWFSNGMDFISEYNAMTDAVFLDIVMPHMDGMDCAVRLREIDNEVPLIFVTNMIQYAVKGYTVDAMGYMVKPLEYFPFSVLMDKVVTRITRFSEKEIFIQTRDRLKRLYLHNLLYVEVMDHYLIYHMIDGEYREIGKMKDVEVKLIKHGFFRCGNSYLVNLKYVRDVDDDYAVVNGEKIFISRRRKKDFLIAINDYLKKGGM